MISRLDIVDEARRWIGTPWIHQASLKDVGCDCIGLVVGIARAFGLPESRAWLMDPEFRGYARIPNKAKLLKACDKYLDRGSGDRGDVLLLSFAGEPMHFAIASEIAGHKTMIHGFERVGRVVENTFDFKWQRRFVAAYRYRGVA